MIQKSMIRSYFVLLLIKVVGVTIITIGLLIDLRPARASTFNVVIDKSEKESVKENKFESKSVRS